MEIQIKKSPTNILQTNKMFSDSLHKYYNFETDGKGDVIINNSLIQRLKDKKIKDRNEMYLAWDLVQLIKKSTIDFDSPHNFTLCVEDGRIKITVGGDCAIIKNNLPEYVTYLRLLKHKGIESYIEFNCDKK